MHLGVASGIPKLDRKRQKSVVKVNLKDRPTIIYVHVTYSYKGAIIIFIFIPVSRVLPAVGNIHTFCPYKKTYIHFLN